MPQVDIDKVSDLIRQASAEFIMPRYQVLQDDEVATKTGPRDFVTQADIEAEAFLVQRLPEILPGSIVIGEEGVSSGNASLDALKDPNAPVWVVDPVDGTYNFVHGKREFGVMVALVVDGQTRTGWIYDILGDEMIVGDAGAGAFVNGERRLSVQPQDNHINFSGFVNPRYFPKSYQPHVLEIKEQFKSCRSMGCAAHEYLNIARGDAQFSVYSRLKPWDHLPGVLILQEAGGYAAKWDMSDYAAADHAVGLISAASEENWNIVREMFLKDLLEN